MGYLDRDYQREASAGVGFGSRLAGCPVVKWLLIINLAVFLLDILMSPDRPRGEVRTDAYRSPLFLWGVFTIEQGLLGGQIWRLITFQFLHGSFLHILVNMFILFMFGPIIERWWKTRAFLAFYLICGIAGALFYTLMTLFPVLPDDMIGTRLLGASAGVFGVLIGVAVIAPKEVVRLLFPPISMTMRTFAIALICFETVLLLTNSANAGGSAGHLGGALMGYLFFKVVPLKNLLMKLDQGKQSIIKPKRKARKSRQGFESKLKPKVKLSSRSRDVDRILDKINAEGLHSLTEEERKILQEASQK